ncbi:MAG TPA: XRE family transcriptional regulator [Alphaproteobacteria bacterium]|jgi:transcriptional regulator with XRE-family HTH domain
MTGVERAFGREQLANLGRQIRALRERRRWSLKRLARESGISITAIRKIELGEANPGLLTILAIVDALGEPIDQVIGLARAKTVSVMVKRAADQPRAADRVPSSRSLTDPLSDAHMYGRVVTLPPHTTLAGADRTNDGARFGFVLEGKVRLTLSDGTVRDLSAGDSFHTIERPPLILANGSSRVARVLQVKEALARGEADVRAGMGDDR